MIKETGVEVPVSQEKSFHMTPEEFRRHGHAVVDWIADYQARVESLPVMSRVKPGEIRAMLPDEAPGSRRGFRGVAQGYGPRDSAGRHALAITELVRILSRAMLRGREFWATCCRRGWAFRECCGRRVRRAPNWKRMSWIGWWACSACPRNSALRPAAGESFKIRLRALLLCALLAGRERATNYVTNKKGCDGRAGGVRLHTNPFFTAESGDDCRHRRRQSAGHRGG